MAPWRPLARAGRRQAPRGPASRRVVLLVGQPAAQRRASPRATSSWSRPRGMAFDQRRRGLAERAGVDRLRDAPRPAVVVELDRRARCGCRRSASAARPARPRDRARAARGATPPAAGSRSCRAARSFPPPCSAARPVLQHDALGLELVADAVGGREVAVLLGFGALGDPGFDRAARSAVRPGTTRLAELLEQARAARALALSAAGSSSADQAATARAAC